MTVSFITLGCKVNQYESEAISELLAKSGIETRPFGEKTDAIVINTCAVTAEGERKARQMVRRAIKTSEGAFVAVTGCAAQLHPEAFTAIKGVSFVCGNGAKLAVAEAILAHRDGMMTKNLPENSFSLAAFEPMRIVKSERTRAYIKIEDGCDSHCAYCIIKKARGGVRSKPIADVVAEAETLLANGYREIVLTGIETSDYGKDLGYDLVTLLETLDNLDGMGRIRLGSLDPAMFRADVTARLAHLDHLCHHFHLSLQSGCSRTLAAMRRRSSAEMIRARIGKLREAMPDVTFTADVIVGFPGETDEDFRETAAFLEEIDLLDCHIFAFSPRPDTEAAVMPDQIASDVKSEREKILAAIIEKSRNKVIGEYIGKTVTALFEEEKGGYAIGHTANFIPVYTKSFENSHNTLANIAITRAEDGKLYGERLTGGDTE